MTHGGPPLAMIAAAIRRERERVGLSLSELAKRAGVPYTTVAEWPLGEARRALEGVAPAYLLPSGPRERYPELRWRARR